jgi:16S rRNA (uracil1498-N3)-methyltransferase
MRRFTLTRERIHGDRVTFDPQESRHMARVLRLGPGDVVIAGDGAGRDYTVRLETLGDTATGTIVGVSANEAESPLALTLVQGVPKGDRMEAIVQALTQLGVHRVAPTLTERVVVRLEPARWRERARRWQRVAREAAKQCGRAVVPDVDPPAPLTDRLALAGTVELALCLWEGRARPLGEALDAAAADGPPRSIAVLVGPEGGLARTEVEAAEQRGWQVVSLGPRILRTETAGPVVAAVLQFRFGDLAGRGGA